MSASAERLTRPLSPSDEERLWAFVDRRGPGECWPWLGGFYNYGYPAFWLRGNTVGAHRVICAMFYGLAAGRHALHSCDNPQCVNPAHLRWGTHRENVQDRDDRGRTLRGTTHGKARLTNDDVRAIRLAHAQGSGLSELGRVYGVTPQAIYQIVNRRSWSHID